MKPYYSHAGITIYHGDCREVLSAFPHDLAQLVLTDIPYNCSQESKGLRELEYGAWDHDYVLEEFMPKDGNEK